MDKMWIIVGFNELSKPFIHSSYDTYQDAVDASYDLFHVEGIHLDNGQIVELEL